MSVLIASELSRETKAILSEDGVCCAVAFWGEGCQRMLTGKGAKVICNLVAGGTNPYALRELAGAELRQCDTLHAKVYVGQGRAIVSSANVSANGLGLEGSEQGNWIEAGVLIEDTSTIKAWFEDLWTAHSRNISDADFESAVAAWNGRQRQRPTVPFEAFRFESGRLPVVAWAGDEELIASEEDIAAALGTADAATVDLLLNGVALDLGDDPRLLSDRWVLFYRAKRDGLPSKRSKPWWVHVSDRYVAKGLRCGKSQMDGMLRSETQPPVPFNAADPGFRSALHEVLRRREYAGLIDRNYDSSKPWFATNDRLTPKLWADLKVQYAIPPR